MKDKTAKHRVARHTEKRKAQGWVRVSVWCKAEDREKVLRYAERLRTKAK